MSGPGDAVKDDRSIESRLYPRLRAFAIALTGAPRPGAALAQAAMANLQSGQVERGQTSPLLAAYREVHGLWMERAASRSNESGGRADPRCFALPASTPEAASRYKGLAQVIADLPPQQRATLLLIYGEGLSYDEAAEVFDSEVQAVMTRVARGHVAVGHWLDRRGESEAAHAGDSGTDREDAAAQDRRGNGHDKAGQVA